MLQIESNVIRNKKLTEGSIYEIEDHFHANDFMLLQRIIRKSNSILDLKSLMEQIIEDASKTLGFAKCGVLLYDEKTNKLELAAVTGWQGKMFTVGEQFAEGEGIVWRAFKKQQVIYYPDINEYPEEIPCDFTSQSHVDIPLISHGKVIGILNAQHDEIDGLSKHKIQVLKILAAHLSIAIQNATLYEAEKKEKETMLRDLQEASAIQQRMFPKDAPNIENFSISGMCEPCQEVGGDWYDFFQLPSGKVGVVLADVSGKGLAAAFLMSSARTIIRMTAMQEESPAKLLSIVNDILTGDLPASRFITLVYAVIDPKTKLITIANAGHAVPILISENNVDFLNIQSGLPLGIKHFEYKQDQLIMQNGAKLFLYSDGVTEAMNADRELFDDERLIMSLKNPEADIYSLYSDVKKFAGSMIQTDDLTIVKIEKL